MAEETMRTESVVNKFIEKFGSPDPKPHLHFIQGSKNGSIGLTTEPGAVLQVFRDGFFRRHQRHPTILIDHPSNLLPMVHIEFEGFTYDIMESDLLEAFRLLQNSPFKNLKVIHSSDPMPIMILRDDFPISVLLAPDVLPMPKPEEITKKKKFLSQAQKWHEKLNYIWMSKMPNCSYWLVEVESGERFMKCRNCGEEKLITDWIKRRDTMNHPQCSCECSTYDDFCGCQRAVKMRTFDRIRRESTNVKRFARGDLS